MQPNDLRSAVAGPKTIQLHSEKLKDF